MYTCRICGQTFTWQSGLSRHGIKHKNHSFQCHLCSKTFKRKDKLRDHETRLHIQEMKEKKVTHILSSFAEENEIGSNENDKGDIGLLQENNDKRGVDQYTEKLDCSENTSETSEKLNVSSLLGVLNEHHTANKKEEDTLFSNIDLRDVVGAIRINILFGIDYQLYENLLRNMDVIY